MAIRHGNKTYLQILLDPHRAKLLMEVAESLQVRPTSWIRDVVYRQLESCVPGDAYEKAFNADQEAWRDSVKRRVDGRLRLKKESENATEG
ncbi:MAG: hypothetical protein VW840_14200 [Gammaproteobacteria bacterium]